MGDVLGFVGQLGAAGISAEAAQTAQEMQLAAIQQQRQFVYSNLDPSVIGSAATAADAARAKNQLALQGQIDPALLQARYASEAKLNSDLSSLGVQSGQVADQATKEALAGTPGLTDAKNKLVDAALDQLKAGATLPPDVEAQLVQSGLENTGTVTQGVGGAQGIGGTMLRTILGTAGVNLQLQRQNQAAQLLTSASNLDAQRQQILQGLFPKLQSQQLSNLAGAGSVFGTAQSAAPNAGLSGQDVANIWLARVGATNSLTAQQGQVLAQGAMNQGNIWSNALGGATGSVGNSLPTLAQIVKSSPSTGYTPITPSAAASEGGDIPISPNF